MGGGGINFFYFFFRSILAIYGPDKYVPRFIYVPFIFRTDRLVVRLRDGQTSRDIYGFSTEYYWNPR